MKPCLTCGTPSPESRCDDCAGPPSQVRRGTARERGYSTQWDKLSRRARRTQPFCSDCGATENLTTDHLPSAWERAEQGKPLRLADVDVCCNDCNVARGSSRPGSERARQALGTYPATSGQGPWGKAQGQMNLSLQPIREGS